MPSFVGTLRNLRIYKLTARNKDLGSNKSRLIIVRLAAIEMRKRSVCLELASNGFDRKPKR